MNDKTFEVFVNQNDSLTDGWSNELTAAQVRVKLAQLIANKIAGAQIEIPETILAQFKNMHICFPGVVCSVENISSTEQLNGFFEYFERCEMYPGGTWRIKISWEKDSKSVVLEEMSADVILTLSKMSAIVKIAAEGILQQPTPKIEEINERMWGLVR